MGIVVGVAITFNGIWEGELDRGGVECVGVVFSRDSECFGSFWDRALLVFSGKSGFLVVVSSFEIYCFGGGVGVGGKDGEYWFSD